jgi:hypothetical protein
MMLTSKEIAECLMKVCESREAAIYIAERKFRETFLFEPAESILWRDAAKALENRDDR